METFDPKEYLLFGLKHFEIDIEKQAGKYVHLPKDYVIEIEGPNLYKLMQDGAVIAPFDDVEELCLFIKQDMAHG